MVCGSCADETSLGGSGGYSGGGGYQGGQGGYGSSGGGGYQQGYGSGGGYGGYGGTPFCTCSMGPDAKSNSQVARVEATDSAEWVHRLRS